MADPLVPLRGFRHASDVRHGELPDMDARGNCRWCGRRIESSTGICRARVQPVVYVTEADPGVSPLGFRP